MTETAQEHGKDPFHAAEVVKENANYVFADLFERADLPYVPDVRVVSDPVKLDEDDPNTEELSSFWSETVDQELDDPSIQSNLLIDDYSSYDDDPLGQAEGGSMFGGCVLDGGDSDAAVITEGQRLLELDVEPITSPFMYADYVEEQEHYRAANRDKYVLYGALHELGHNQCLDHALGTYHESGDDQYTATLMMGFYATEYESDGGNQFETGDELVLELRFSDENVELFREYMED
jgi:hypothetical protein